MNILAIFIAITYLVIGILVARMFDRSVESLEGAEPLIATMFWPVYVLLLVLYLLVFITTLLVRK